MDFEKDEDKKIKELLQGYTVKPPEDLMKNYVAEVRTRIQNASRERPAFGIPAPAIWLLVALSLLVALVLMKPPAQKARAPQAALQEKAPDQAPAEKAPPSDQESFDQELEKVEEQADFEELSDSLMILEMLGEDTGLMDDSDTVEADLNFFAGT